MKQNAVDEHGLRGVIINTAGIEGIRGHAGHVANAAASGAIITMTKHLAKDFSAESIRVVTIAPAFIGGEEGTTQTSRFGDPDEFAFMVQSVILNTYINGTTIELTGGLDLVKARANHN